MNQSPPDFKASLSVLRMLHLGLTVPLVLFTAFVLYNNMENPGGEGQDLPEFIIYIPGILLIIAFPVSSFLFKKFKDDGLTPGKDLQGKIAVYQTSNLIRMSLFESAGLFAVVISFLTGNSYLLIVVAIVLFMFYTLFPTPSKIALELELTTEEKDQLVGR